MPSTGQRIQRLNKARLQLLETENRLGILPTETYNGKIWHLNGSYKTLITVLASHKNNHPWIATLGLSNFGWTAAHEMGINLNCLINIRAQEQNNAEILADLIDGFDLTICGPLFLTQREQNRLAARVRQRKNLFITIAPWPGLSRNWNPQETLRKAI